MNTLDGVTRIIQGHLDELNVAEAIAIRPGFQEQNGWLTQQPAIIVVLPAGAAVPGLPAVVEGVPVQVRQATDVEQLQADDPEAFAKVAAQREELRGGAFDVRPDEEERGGQSIDYTPADTPLAPVTGTFPVTLHASPDAGWPTLQSFLAGTQATLSVSMYDFTSKHIADEVASDLTGKTLELTLDHPAKNPTADQTDPETVEELQQAIGDKFSSAWALVRSNPDVGAWIFPTAYHIKVAVRDSSAVWLSSGNWNNSNQPDFDPINKPADSDQALARKSDRDWHVIIEHAGLAQQFEAFLKHDFDVASANGARGAATETPGLDLQRGEASANFTFHPPLVINAEEMTITPLLTPDPEVYQPAMLNLLQSAQQKLYIQLQYIHPSNKDADADFTALIQAVVNKIQAGVDVRIILSQWQRSGGWLDRLQAAGVDLKTVKIQNGVHNKGFVVDSKIVALGSQNWSSEGVLRNRDASVIIENAHAAAYFEQIFLHDWDNIAKQSIN